MGIECKALVIAATNKPEAIRDDLKARFHIVPIPPLRKIDIPTLVDHFLAKHSGRRHVKREIVEGFCNVRYEGNVRELKKECEALYAKRKDSIFSARKTEDPIKFHPTDYDATEVLDYGRYMEEYRLWHKYLAPRIGKFDLSFKYEYQHHDPHLEDGSIMYLLGDPQSQIDIWSILKAVDEGGSEVESRYPYRRANTRDAFARTISRILKEKRIAYLLLNIAMRYEGASLVNRQMVKAYDYAPKLIPLLHMQFKDAEAAFGEIYFDYLESVCKNDTETATAAGMTLDAYKRRKQGQKGETTRNVEHKDRLSK
jgi:DNA-binding NtrC family response regulator